MRGKNIYIYFFYEKVKKNQDKTYSIFDEKYLIMAGLEWFERRDEKLETN